jgi:hypothetical protein
LIVVVVETPVDRDMDTVPPLTVEAAADVKLVALPYGAEYPVDTAIEVVPPLPLTT